METKELTIENTQVKYVTFRIGDEIYGIDVMRAKEVMYLSAIAEVPDTCSYMKGVMDLRGTIIPLVDTRLKFHLPEREYDQDTVIIIVEFEDQIIGMIVDSVLDVAGIPTEEIQGTTHFSAEVEKDYIQGITKINDNLIMILDSDKIFTDEELNRIKDSEQPNNM